MLIMLNNYNYITSYCEEGFTANGYIEVDTGKLKGEELCFNYQYINGKLINNPIPNTVPEGVNLIYNGKEWLDDATLEEQREYWLNKALETSKKLEEYKNIGLSGGQEYLIIEKKLETYKKNYINVCQDEAITIDKHMNSTKPVK